jgi:hypothetical protein
MIVLLALRVADSGVSLMWLACMVTALLTAGAYGSVTRPGRLSGAICNNNTRFMPRSIREGPLMQRHCLDQRNDLH